MVNPIFLCFGIISFRLSLLYKSYAQEFIAGAFLKKPNAKLAARSRMKSSGHQILDF